MVLQVLQWISHLMWQMRLLGCLLVELRLILMRVRGMVSWGSWNDGSPSCGCSSLETLVVHLQSQ